MQILGIETSCDETSAAVITADTSGLQLLSNVISTSLPLHSKTGGIIPEVAARQQIKFILPVIDKALLESGIKHNDIDAIAVTYGPGLIGSLLVGVETAKTLSYIWNTKLIPVNHLLGHIYANFIDENSIDFPFIGLIVSGGHTDLLLFKSHSDFTWLGGTRDDAAGEAFDKIGRLLGMPYPAGPAIEAAAKKGNPHSIRFPRPMIGSKDFDFSFSGLKAAVLREVQSQKDSTVNSEQYIFDISAGVQEAIIDVIVRKTIKAAEKYSVKAILLGGGVAANTKFKEELELNASRSSLSPKLFVPPKSLCTDNAAMIAAAGYFHQEKEDWQNVTANPELYFD